jgi:hypothetical protein
LYKIGPRSTSGGLLVGDEASFDDPDSKRSPLADLFRRPLIVSTVLVRNA